MEYAIYLTEQKFKNIIEETKIAFQEDLEQISQVIPHLSYDISEFLLKIELRKIYDFLTGKTLEKPEDFNQIIQLVKDLTWKNFFLDQMYPIRWDDWSKQTNLGRFIRCAIVADDLHNGKEINIVELSYLAGMTYQGVQRSVDNGTLKATKVGREWKVEAEEAIKWLKGRSKG